MTGVGPGGAYGQLVPNHVNLEHKLGHGAARNHRLNMAGERVQERLVINEFATRSLVQSMGAGQTGVGGRPAASPVELVSRNVLEAAHDQRRNLVENHAWEKYGKLASATVIHAQCMEVGVSGVLGLPVLKPVAEGQESERDPVQIHLLFTEGKVVEHNITNPRSVL